MSDSVLHDLPTEFFSEFPTLSTGRCDGQSVLPISSGFRCHCTCGQWDIVTETNEEGLVQARAHTAATDAALLAESEAEEQKASAIRK